jgi:hypothetical protein
LHIRRLSHNEYFYYARIPINNENSPCGGENGGRMVYLINMKYAPVKFNLCTVQRKKEEKNIQKYGEIRDSEKIRE